MVCGLLEIDICVCGWGYVGVCVRWGCVGDGVCVEGCVCVGGVYVWVEGVCVTYIVPGTPQCLGNLEQKCWILRL